MTRTGRAGVALAVVLLLLVGASPAGAGPVEEQAAQEKLRQETRQAQLYYGMAGAGFAAVVGAVFYLLSTADRTGKRQLARRREQQRQEAMETPIECKYRPSADA